MTLRRLQLEKSEDDLWLNHQLLNLKKVGKVPHLVQSTLEHFLSTGERPVLSCGDYDVLILEADGEVLLMKNGVLYPDRGNGVHPERNPHLNILGWNEEDDPIAVVVRSYCDKLSLILNGDTNVGPSELDLRNYPSLLESEHPTLSFRCLSRFYSEATPVLQRLVRGTLELVDHTPDAQRPMTPAEKRDWRNNKLKLPPGFSLVHGKLHRAGTVLLYDKKKEWFLLFGQDENEYFGVQLPEECWTIDGAFKSLVPKQNWPPMAKGQEMVRQGEWFIIPVVEKAVPKKEDCSILFEESDLPHGDGSNTHTVITDDGRVSKNGDVFAWSPYLQHSRHVTVQSSGWCVFRRNRAVRSFSEEGVD